MQYLNSYSLYYTNEHLFLKNKRGERSIPLTAVKNIKRNQDSKTTILGIPYYSYNLEFINEEKGIEITSFSTSSLNPLLDEFKDLVRSKFSD